MRNIRVKTILCDLLARDTFGQITRRYKIFGDKMVMILENNEYKNINDSTDLQILLFTSTKCPFCPQAQKNLENAINELGLHQSVINLIDIIKKPDLAEKHKVLTLPTTIIGEFYMMGVVEKEELMSAITQTLLSSPEILSKLMEKEEFLVEEEPGKKDEPSDISKTFDVIHIFDKFRYFPCPYGSEEAECKIASDCFARLLESDNLELICYQQREPVGNKAILIKTIKTILYSNPDLLNDANQVRENLDKIISLSNEGRSDEAKILEFKLSSYLLPLELNKRGICFSCIYKHYLKRNDSSSE